jgi:hypothetical protein
MPHEIRDLRKPPNSIDRSKAEAEAARFVAGMKRTRTVKTQRAAPTVKRAGPEMRKTSAEERIAQLLAAKASFKEKADEAQTLVLTLQQVLSERDQELAQQKIELTKLRAESEGRKSRCKEMPTRIAEVREQGRKMFGDFDAVITGVPVGHEAFEALLASPNGPELMYAAGLGLRIITLLRQQQEQAEFDQQRVEYYRQLNRQQELEN